MKRILKTYDLILDVKGPVFIGSGNEISKKEYIFLSNGKAAVFDIQKLYRLVNKYRKQGLFEEFMVGNKNSDLKRWLEENRIPAAEYLKCVKYTLDGNKIIREKGKQKLIHVQEFIKDAYGNPYVPGSSVKGMLRTILLSYDVMERPQRYRKDMDGIEKDVLWRQAQEIRINKKNVLKKNIESIEEKYFYTLRRESSRFGDARNDWMTGMIISDSEPLKVEDLTLCQKIDSYPDGNERAMPLLRECLKPGTQIKCQMTIDEELCKVHIAYITNAVKKFNEQYYSNYSGKFLDADRLRPDSVFLGGGAGFVSKTVIYPLFPGKEGVKIVSKIYDKTKVPFNHKHREDVRMGVSPHMLKCTRYHGKKYEMGLCKLTITPQK